MKIKSPNRSGSAHSRDLAKTVIFWLFVIFLFPLENSVSAGLPASELWREGLIKNVIGFGRNTTGGAGGSLCRVTNLSNSGVGSLRACAEAIGPQWIVFDVSGTITLSSELLVKSNKTIDGRGQNVVIENRGFILGRWGVGGVTDNIIIHNITIREITGNGAIIIAEDASNVWVDHVTFKNGVDETIYVGSNGSDGISGAAPHSVTLSWNHFIGNWPTLMGGTYSGAALLVSDPTLPEDVAITITLHHNYYDVMQSRHPLARYAKIHAFNNYYKMPYTGVDALTDVKFFSENDIFEVKPCCPSGANPVVKVHVGGTAYGDPRGALNTKVLNPWLINGATVEQINTSTIFNPSSYYAYAAETANASLLTKIIGNAGSQNVTILSPLAPTNLAVK